MQWSCLLYSHISMTRLTTNAFVVVVHPHPAITSSSLSSSSLLTLQAKKKKTGKNTAGQGFGASSSSSSPPAPATTSSTTTAAAAMTQTQQPLKSESSPIPSPVSRVSRGGSESVEERNIEILKEKFGLRSYEEQVGDLKAAESISKNKSRMQKWKDMKDDEFDIFQVVPTNVLNAIDVFLKTGLTVTTVLFILAGFGITAEAWSAATHNALPPGVDDFIVSTVEPNFTTGLLVLLSFSVSLGIFASAQLGSSSSIYTED